MQDDSNRLPVDRKLLARFFEKIRIDPNVTFNGSPCWLWIPPKDKNGYGRFWHVNQSRGAYNVAYRMFVGELGSLVPDHLCRVRQCVNPAHLEAVTQGENVLRGDTFVAANMRKTHCLRGHEFTQENTKLYRGSRSCRQCLTDYSFQHRKPRRPKRTHCMKGHEFTKVNSRIDSNGKRHCRICGHQTSLNWYYRNHKDNGAA